MEINASFLEKIRVIPQYFIPQHLLSGWMYAITRWSWKPFKNLLIRIVINLYKVDMNLAVQPDYRKYETFNHFFTRELNPETRPVSNTKLVCSPVDGLISQAGNIVDSEILQAKGHTYKLSELLAGHEALSGRFKNGHFATIYLSPRDYHRIHMPVTGQLQEMIYVPGKLFSVNGITTRCVPRLFARNERLITIFQTEMGSMAVILIGAIFVGSMETVWSGQVTPAARREIRHSNYQEERDIILAKGEELGRFNMGSTVIVLFQQGQVEWLQEFIPGDKVIMGQDIAKPIATSN